MLAIDIDIIYILCLQLIYSVKDSGELVAPPSSSSSDPADTAEYNLVYRAAEDRCRHIYLSIY